MGKLIHFSAAVLGSREQDFNPAEDTPLVPLRRALHRLRSENQVPHFTGHDNQSILKRIQHLTLLGELESAIHALARIETTLQTLSSDVSPRQPLKEIQSLEGFLSRPELTQNQIAAELRLTVKKLKSVALLFPLESKLSEIERHEYINTRIIGEIEQMINELEQAGLTTIPYQKVHNTMAQAAQKQLDREILVLQKSPYIAQREFAIDALLIAQQCGVNTAEAEDLIEAIFPVDDYNRERQMPHQDDRVTAARNRIGSAPTNPQAVRAPWVRRLQ